MSFDEKNDSPENWMDWTDDWGQACVKELDDYFKCGAKITKMYNRFLRNFGTNHIIIRKRCEFGQMTYNGSQFDLHYEFIEICPISLNKPFFTFQLNCTGSLLRIAQFKRDNGNAICIEETIHDLTQTKDSIHGVISL